ncbi:MAG: NTP transferase domain-containing protein [Candidatus Kerfeldbacteria bacterium]|nr:NTP transferase domain-containing protein [Candidatus Kerfeldbacteria bacterium]
MMSPIVIGAGGRGTRMEELTQETPKHLLPVLGKPFLSHVLDRVRQAGFQQIIVVVGYRGDAIRAFVSAMPDVTVADQFAAFGEQRYGTAVAVQAAARLVGNVPFVYLMGDNLYSATDLQTFGGAHGSCIGGMEHPEPQRFGVLETSGDRLVRIVEKPEHPSGTLINVGLYRFTPDVFPVVEKLPPSGRGEFEITDAVNVLAQSGTVRVVRLRGTWHDFSRPGDIPRVEAYLRHSHGNVPPR